MLTCEGYIMFRGSVKITPVIRPDGTRWKEPFFLTGTWLYKPEVKTWYCRPADGSMTSSWPSDILSDFMDEQGIPIEFGRWYRVG